MMAAKGRPRMTGPREPNGRLSRAKTVVSTHRDMAIIERERLNPIYGSPLGRLLREDKITRKAFEAGCTYRAMRQDMDRLLGVPGRSPKAMDLHAIKGFSLADERDERTVDRFQRKFDAVETALGARNVGGRRPGTMWWAIDQAVVHDISLVGHEQHLTLIRALGVLVDFFALRS